MKHEPSTKEVQLDLELDLSILNFDLDIELVQLDLAILDMDLEFNLSILDLAKPN
jgi:hypothetical protein